MKLGHEKVIHLSHVIVDALADLSGVRFTAGHNDVRLKIVDFLRIELRREAEMERTVRTKITTQKRSIPEGSQEWDVLFRKYYDEELEKIRSVKG
jgi:hypothetical protein